MFGTTARHQIHHQHHHYPNHTRGPAVAPTALSPESAKAGDLFESFIAASTFKSVVHHFRLICDVLKLRPTNFRQFYPNIKSQIRSWRAQVLWSKYDKRASHKCYNEAKAAINSKVLIIGSGPCGLRAAIEAQLLGAKVVVVEKRDRFSRNNVLHLWPFVIADLKALGAKKFYGKFCAGAIDHISIRQLQCILLKIALLLGVEVIEGVTFEELLQPPEDQSQRTGWHARFSPAQHPVNHYEFDVLIGADGKRNTLLGFKRKEFRGKLAIAITANFINRHSEQEARVQEISGVAFIFNQKFFKELYAETGIDLENIVYYKDETHYFVMTAKKHSLLDKGVIITDYSDTQQLLHTSNVDREALCAYAREAADFSTDYLLPHTDFAVNHYGKPDIAMFDFTSMFAAENACRVRQKHGHKLLTMLVGDSLLEPFWPTGSGCARGFLSCFDACWAIRSWASDSMTPLEVIAERESTYRLLGQTTPENLAKDILSYTLEPSSRYPTINLKAVLPFQVRHLRNTDQPDEELQEETQQLQLPRKRKRKDSIMHPDTLLAWCQKQVENHPNILIEDLDASFKSGMALCAIIHRFRPFYIEFGSLLESNEAENNQRAFDILQNEFAISPVMTGRDMAACDFPDKLTMISYLSQVCETFRGQIPQFMGQNKTDEGGEDLEDFPMALNDELPKTNLVKSETSRSEGNLMKCKLLNTKELLPKDDLYRSKKRRSEVGSLDKLDRELKKATAEQTDNFSDRVKDLEDKFKIGDTNKQKPKELVRAIGKLEKSDWNMAAIEKKIGENTIPGVSNKNEKVPKWSRDSYNDKQLSIERRLRENGEDEDRIAKYLDIDASLKRMERKLKEGSTLDVGLRGHNKVSNLANQLASKLVRNDQCRTVQTKQQTKAVVLPSCGSDLCYFCSTRVYLVERMSAEGKFFHRKCFKCSYCHSLLRLGNYIYDREGRCGGHFFCIPHLGMAPKVETKRRQLPLMPYGNKTQLNGEQKSVNSNALFLDPSLVDGRGTTPERVEFENSLVEQSDEDEYLSEEEWTDRNFGMSANELDETDSECSDFGDDEEDQLEYEVEYQMSAEETKRLAEKWNRRYSSKADVPVKASDSDDLSEERGADGDESHTATEGEYEDDADDDGEAIKRARALRRQELNINVNAPSIHTSDSGSDTEIATEDESEESDTHIDTDSDFVEDDGIAATVVPKIVFHESTVDEETSPQDTVRVVEGVNPHAEHLQRLLRRTESTEAMAARRNQLLRQNYLLGGAANTPKRSASFADVGDRFKNFMDKISATQTKLKPAPQPGAAMQAFLKGSKGSSLVSAPIGFESTHRSNLPPTDCVRTTNTPDIIKVSSVSSQDSSALSSAVCSGHQLPAQQNAPQPSLVSSHCDNYCGSVLFGKESELNTADTKDLSTEGEMFNFPIDGDVVEAINAEIMTSNAPEEGTHPTGDSCLASEPPEDPDCRQSESPLAEDPPNEAQFTISFVTEPPQRPLMDCLETETHEGTVDLQSESDTISELSDDLSVSSGTDINKTELIDRGGHEDQVVNENTRTNQLLYENTLKGQMLESDLYSAEIKPSTVPNEFVFDPKPAAPWKEHSTTAFECVVHSDDPNSSSNNSAKTIVSAGFDIMDDIDLVFDQLAGEALDDLAKLDDRNLNVDEDFSGLNTDINFVCEDARFERGKIRRKTDNDAYRIDKKADLEEFNDTEEAISWAQDSALDSAGEEFSVSEQQIVPKVKASCLSNVPTQINHAAMESRGDIEYMDTSSASSSSDSSEPFSYNELQDAQSPITNKPAEEPNFPIITSLSHSSITPSANKSVEKSHSFDNKRIFGQVVRSPETPSLLDSYTSPSGPSPGRYEGYIPRFKDRVTPFRFVRDSIDVRKNSVSKPHYNPTKEVVKCESSHFTLDPAPSPTSHPPQKPRDGDLVRDMVMSRITKPDKGNRRGSRGSLLLSSGSRSSLLGDILPDTSGSLGSLSGFNVSSRDQLSNNDVYSQNEETNHELIDHYSQMKSRNVLPATPLTHPEKFNKDNSISVTSLQFSRNADGDSSPDTYQYNILEEDSHLINRKKSMGSRPQSIDPFESSVKPRPSLESRAVRHLDSPLMVAAVDASAVPRQMEIFTPRHDDYSVTLQQMDTSPIQFNYGRPRRASESEVESGHCESIVDPSKAVSHWNVAEKSVIGDKEVRLKKLLSEHRKKEYESSKTKNVDSCVRDCLEEYRQKRYSAPSPHLLKEKVCDDTCHRQNKRPSVLELEALQVFTSPAPECVPGPPLVPSESNDQPEMRKVKKSKDRERRRSLIQVVAGMFNKSDDKKKSDDKSTKENASVEPSSSESHSSPSVRERFSKLRLTKPKEKASDRSDHGAAAELPRRETKQGVQSPPTAPSTSSSPRNLFSFLTKSSEKKAQPPAAEDDDEQRKGCRDVPEGQQTPSARRHKAALRAAKQAEHKRLRIAQEIQRQLQECEIKTRELEDKGIQVEQALRGHGKENATEGTDLMRDWFSLVHERNALSRWEQELTVKARELQLEDRHMRLENELRQRMACPESDKKRFDIDREGVILAEMLEILEQKDSLVELLEDHRKRYVEEDKDLRKVMENKGLRLPHRQQSGNMK